MAINYFSDDISFSHLQKDIHGYSWATFKQDAFAALSVALLTVPQAMAYALLAGLPVSCGLFAAIYSAIFAAIFGSSRHIVVGPSNAIAILIQAGTSEILFNHFRDLTGPERTEMAVQILTQLAFLTGMLQLLAAGCKLGRLTQFVSYSVIIGYIAGTAFAVLVNQLFTFLAIPRFPGVHSLYERAVFLVSHLYEAHLPTCLIAVSSFTLLFTLKKLNKKIPAGLITLVYGAVAAFLVDYYSDYLGLAYFVSEENFNWHSIELVGDTTKLWDVIPTIGLPYFNTRIMNEILPIAFALALLSVMETTSVSKTIAASSGQRLSINQEIFGIGFGNIVSAFTAAMPVSGSPSRSIMNYSSGAQTRFAAVLNAVIVGFFLYSFGFFVSLVPLAALSALLIHSSGNIVNTKQFLVCLKATSSDAFVLWITLLSCIFLSLDMAFYIGVILSVILYLKKAAIPQLVEYDVDEAGELKKLTQPITTPLKKIRIIKVEGELFFGAADLFQRTLKSIAEDDTNTRVILLQLKNARDIDATACLALQQLHEYLIGSSRVLIACGITPAVWDVLSDSGLVEQIGKENLFVFDEKHPHAFMQKALHRAKEQIKKIEEVVPELLVEPASTSQNVGQSATEPI